VRGHAASCKNTKTQQSVGCATELAALPLMPLALIICFVWSMLLTHFSCITPHSSLLNFGRGAATAASTLLSDRRLQLAAARQVLAPETFRMRLVAEVQCSNEVQGAGGVVTLQAGC
jgi:hypothetical protein